MFFDKKGILEILAITICFYIPAYKITNSIYIFFYGKYHILKFTSVSELAYNILNSNFISSVFCFLLLYLVFYLMLHVIIPIIIGFIPPSSKVKNGKPSKKALDYVFQSIGISEILIEFSRKSITNKQDFNEMLAIIPCCLLFPTFCLFCYGKMGLIIFFPSFLIGFLVSLFFIKKIKAVCELNSNL